MNIKTKPTLLAIAVFLLITIFYSSYEAASDGLSLIGFPFTFNTYTHGKMDPSAAALAPFGFNTVNFVLDALVLGLFVFTFNLLWFKFQKKTLIL